MLNAFRHHRNSHRAQMVAQSIAAMCSTPFGIIGIRTRFPRPCAGCRYFGAQRLSASSEFAPRQVVDRVQRVIVLNAFRHHRNSHPGAESLWNDVANSAQRLSASSEFARYDRLERTRSERLCAQRLSASSEFAPPILPSTPSCESVLNAFRHHRNSHCIPPRFADDYFQCSTPFGIIGIRTGVQVFFYNSPFCAQRLSASSEFALSAVVSRLIRLRCSTPFGIIGIRTTA